MRASLVLVLLLTAVASAQAGRSVSCENKCNKPVWCNGKEVAPGGTLILVDVDVSLLLLVKDKYGKEHSGTFAVPLDVTAVVVVYDGVFVKLKVKAVSLLFGLLQTVIGLVLGSLKCYLY